MRDSEGFTEVKSTTQIRKKKKNKATKEEASEVTAPDAVVEPA